MDQRKEKDVLESNMDGLVLHDCPNIEIPDGILTIQNCSNLVNDSGLFKRKKTKKSNLQRQMTNDNPNRIANQGGEKVVTFLDDYTIPIPPKDLFFDSLDEELLDTNTGLFDYMDSSSSQPVIINGRRMKNCTGFHGEECSTLVIDDNYSSGNTEISWQSIYFERCEVCERRYMWWLSGEEEA
jgi:hypothetical protein